MNIGTKALTSALAVMLSLCGSLFLPASATAHETADSTKNATKVAWPDSSGYTRSERAYAIPDVMLTDSDAQPVRLRTLLEGDAPVMVNFIFTTCGTICPVMVKVFAELPDKLGAQSSRHPRDTRARHLPGDSSKIVPSF